MKMDNPVGATPLDKGGVLGSPMVRVDGRLKVTGAAKYAYEFKQAPEVAVGFVVQSTIGRGRIRSIDTRAAMAMPGVLLILSHENAPAQGTGAHTEAHPVLNSDRVEYWGQPVALVVAGSFEVARAAAYAVVVAYDEEHGHYAIGDGTAHATKPPARNGEPPDSAVGDFASAFAAAPVRIDVTYTTPPESHAMMEPHATIAWWDGDKLTLQTANQMLNRGQTIVGKTLNMPPSDVRILSPYIGGGFGAKLWANADAILAAIAARQLERPVKVGLTRQQVFHVTTHRSDTVQRLRLGAHTDGRIVAIGHDVFSGNTQTETGFEAAASQTRTLYAGPNRLTRHRLVALDIPIASAMRAPGEAPGLLALECAMDELAERLSMDPIELRRRNEPAEDPEKHIPYSSRHLIDCLDEGARRFSWNARDPQPGRRRDGQWLVGIGVASATRGNPLQASDARVRIGRDGMVDVRMAMTDIGTGTYTILTQIGAEMMGVPPAHVRVVMGDTDFPMASGSGGSFGAASSGSALYVACETLRAQLAKKAGVDPEAAVFADGRITSGGVSYSIAELAGPDGMEADGGIQPGSTLKEYSQQSYGAQFAEVGVDVDTGEVRLRRMLGVFTAGRILNAQTARSQAIGGMIFGVSGALEEMLMMDPRFGSYVNHDLAEYHVAVHADIPEIDAVFLPELDTKSNPLKSKGIGELGICGAGAAVANAIYNACGVRVRDYPITLDKVLRNLPAQQV